MKKVALGIFAGAFTVGFVLAIGGIWLYQWDATSWGMVFMAASAVGIYIYTEE